MNLMDNITDDQKQEFTMITDKNERITVSLNYYVLQQGWFMDLEYMPTAYKILGLRVTTGLNILKAWKNVIPFGIMITTDEDQEPFFVDSFSGGTSKFYLLQEGEI